MTPRTAGVRVFFTIVSLALCACVAACVGTPSRPATLPRGDLGPFTSWLRARVNAELERTGATAIAVAVVNRDGPVLLEGWGRGALAGKVTPDSRFRVGSISKLVTSLTALSLRDEGLLDLDAPVEQALPWFRVGHRAVEAPRINAHLLMTHHSGLPSTFLHGMYGDGSIAFEDHAHLLHEEEMVRAPGAMFTYSDIGYTLLGTELEAVGHRPFATLAAERVLAPLGMTHSSFERSHAVLPTVVEGHPFVENPPVTLPANGLVSTPRDLAALAHALLSADGAGLPRARLDEVMTPHDTAPMDLDWRTGFGLNQNAAFAPSVGPVYWHSGQTLACTTELIVCPAAGIAIVVMTNTHEAGMVPSILGWDAMALAIEQTTGVRVDAAPPVEAASFSADELTALAGTWPTEYGVITLARDGDHLRGRAFDEDFELVPTASRTFLPRVLAFGVLPVVPELMHGVEMSFEELDGQTVLVSRLRGLRVLRGVRVTPPAAIPARWRARVGHWRNAQRGRDQITVDGADLSLADGFLWIRVHVAHSAKPLIMVLAPTDDVTAVTQGVGRYLGETVQVRGEASSERLHIVGYDLERDD